MKNTYYIILLSLLSFASCSTTAQEKTEEDTKVNAVVLGVNEFKAAFDQEESPQLIDVRTPNEFVNGSISTAINYNFLDGTLQKEISSLDKNKPVYVFCAAGGRSAKASKLLIKEGFTNVIDLKGGYTAWSANK